MDKTTKTVLIVIGSVMLLCMCGVAVLALTGLWSYTRIANTVDASTTRDLYEVADMANEIAVFTLPEGFGSPYGMHIGGITSIGFASPSKNTHILLTQFPEGAMVNTDEMLNLINKYAIDPDGAWNSTQTTVIEEKPVTVRSQETTLSISEGTSSDGGVYRSAMTTFQGKGGPCLLMIAGPLDEWDISMVDTFIASIQ